MLSENNQKMFQDVYNLIEEIRQDILSGKPRVDPAADAERLMPESLSSRGRKKLLKDIRKLK